MTGTNNPVVDTPPVADTPPVVDTPVSDTPVVENAPNIGECSDVAYLLDRLILVLFYSLHIFM